MSEVSVSSKLHRRRRAGRIRSLIFCVFLLAGVSAAQDFGTADAQCLLRSMQWDIKAADKAYLTVHAKILIRTPDGGDYATLIIGDAPLERLKKFSGTSYDADGEIIDEVGKDDGMQICGYSGYALYEDVCYRRYSLRQARYPYTIDYTYTVECKSLFFWPDWEPSGSLPVERSEYVLSIPNDMPFHRQSSAGIDPDSIVPGGVRSTYYFHVDSLPASDPDPCAASDSTSPPFVKFAPEEFCFGRYRLNGTSWDSLGRGCYEMMGRNLDPDDHIIDLVDSLRSLAPDDRAFCELLHKTLAARTRYVAVEIGVGGLIPSRARETFDRGYGDCKDLAFLYASALQYAGIRAVPVIIRAAPGRITDPNFPRINLFNHVILFAVVETDTIWIDATCQQCDVGDLPADDEHRYVLAVDNQTPGLVLTPSSRPEDNTLRRIVDIRINQDRSLTAAVDIMPEGNLLQRFRARLERSSERELSQLCRDRFGWVGDRYAIDKSTCLRSGDKEIVVGGSFTGTIRNAIHIVGDKQYVNLDFLPYMTGCEIDMIGIKDPQSIDLGYPRRFCDSIIINIPDGWQPSDTLAHVEQTDEFGALEVSMRAEGQKLVVVRTRSCARYAVHPEESIGFGEHLAQVRESMPGRIILVRK